MREFSNKHFCYWLQGYFEISGSEYLDKFQIMLIEAKIEKITTPLGIYTSWLKDVLVAFRSNDYQKDIVSWFLPDIKKYLNGIFYHEIDQSYESSFTLDQLLDIHVGNRVEGFNG